MRKKYISTREAELVARCIHEYFAMQRRTGGDGVTPAQFMDRCASFISAVCCADSKEALTTSGSDPLADIDSGLDDILDEDELADEWRQTHE